MNKLWSYAKHVSTYLCFSLLLAQTSLSQNRGAAPISTSSQSSEGGVRIPPGTLLQVELEKPTNWKHLARNSVVEGRVKLPVFAGSDITIPEGTKVRLTVESVRKATSDNATWKKVGNAIVAAFNPLEKGRPTEYAIRLSKTELEAPEANIYIEASALHAGYAGMIESKGGRSGKVRSLRTPGEKAPRVNRKQQALILQLDREARWPLPPAHDVQPEDRGSNHKARAFLLAQLSASQNRKDDVFQARLAEPVRLGNQVFDAGSLLEGRVSQSTHPRMLSRAGSMRLRIERITSTQRASSGVAGTLARVEAGAGTKYALDEEGGLRGLKPGLANALVDLSIAYALGKITDDLAEAPIRAVGAAMSNAAVANVARYFGLAASAAFLVTRHGRDVYLPRYSEIEVDFRRFGEQPAASATLQP